LPDPSTAISFTVTPPDPPNVLTQFQSGGLPISAFMDVPDLSLSLIFLISIYVILPLERFSFIWLNSGSGSE